MANVRFHKVFVNNYSFNQVNFLNFAIMKIIVIAATKFEIQPAIQLFANTNIQFQVTGIGMLATAVSLTKLLLQHQPNLVIQAGIAGSFNANLPLGKVVVVESEIIGDLGVEEDDTWQDIFDKNLIGADSFPFKQKAITNPHLPKLNTLQLNEVAGITVNEISTNQQRIQQLQAKYNPTVEGMEGAALHYVCTDLNVPFIQIRSISNYIGERDKTKWQMQLSINNLNNTLHKILSNLLEE